MPSRAQRIYVRTFFINRVLKHDGASFQDFFVSIMRKRYADFRTIKPQGSKGDQGNDGFIPEKGEYFQVYAPEDPNSKIAKAVEKAKEDFDKLQASWTETAPIRTYRFVFNDKFKGAYPDVEQALAELKKDHSLESASPYYAQHLEADFLELGEDDQMEILGTIFPDPHGIEAIEFTAITEVLEHLANNRAMVSATAALSVPDFTDKIEFNGLSTAVGALLTSGSYQNGVIEDYFTQIPDFSRRDIRDILRSIYEEEAEELTTRTALPNVASGDLLFFSILDRIIPPSEKAAQDVGISLIAYFFEQCDVFEEPTT